MKALRVLLGSFLIALLLVAALALPVWYVYSQGTRFVKDGEAQARNRSIEMAGTLNTLSGESLYYNNLIALSHTMDTIVEQSKTRSDSFQIEEIFLVDRDGRLLAHSDIARVAAESGAKYDAEKLHFKDVRFKADPVAIEVTERASVDFGDAVRKAGVEPLLIRGVQLLLPDLAASRYHVYGSVYLPDEDLPAGTLHVLVQNRNAVAVLGYFVTSVMQTMGIAILGAGILWLIFTVLLTVLVFQKPASRPSPPHLYASGSEGESLNEEEFEPVNSNVADLADYRSRKKGPGHSEDEEEESPARILDAIPLDHL